MMIDEFPINKEIETFFKFHDKNQCSLHDKPFEYFCTNDKCLIEIC